MKSSLSTLHPSSLFLSDDSIAHLREKIKGFDKTFFILFRIFYSYFQIVIPAGPMHRSSRFCFLKRIFDLIIRSDFCRVVRM